MFNYWQLRRAFWSKVAKIKYWVWQQKQNQKQNPYNFWLGVAIGVYVVVVGGVYIYLRIGR